MRSQQVDGPGGGAAARISPLHPRSPRRATGNLAALHIYTTYKTRAPTHCFAIGTLLFILINRPCGEKFVLSVFLASQPRRRRVYLFLYIYTRAADWNVEINFPAVCKNFINLVLRLLLFEMRYVLRFTNKFPKQTEPHSK